MINLDEHKVYVDDLKMEMVPYTVAIKAITEAYENATVGQIEKTLSTTLDTLSSAFDKINKTIASTPNLEENNDQDSSRES